MQAWLPAIGLLGGLVSLLAYPPYIRDMIKGTTRPERATWFIWSVISVIALGTQLAQGGTWSVAMTVTQTLGVVAVFLLSIRYGYGGFKRRDIISLIVAGLGLLLWAVTDQPIVALWVVVLVDAAGAWLTIYKSYLEPETETEITWILDCIANLLAVIAVGQLDFGLMLYPAYLFMINASVLAAIKLGKAKQTTD